MKEQNTTHNLEEVWAQSHGEIGPRTFQELVKLGKRIDAAQERKRRFGVVFSAVAVAASLAIVAALSFTLARDKFMVSPLESTRSLVTNYGQTTSITLEDGTKVSLNAGSSLLYPASFKKGSRIVYLSGEGNFAVAKDPSRPFIVKTAHLNVQALGTTFCVRSYAGDREVRTTLKEGKVKVDIPSAEGQSHLLDPGMQLVFKPADNAVSLAMVEAEKVMSWEEGYLSFSNASFPEIASVLERRFDVSVSYSSENLRQGALNVRFLPDETLEDALDVLKLLIPGFRYRIEGKRVICHF